MLFALILFRSSTYYQSQTAVVQEVIGNTTNVLFEVNLTYPPSIYTIDPELVEKYSIKFSEVETIVAFHGLGSGFRYKYVQMDPNYPSCTVYLISSSYAQNLDTLWAFSTVTQRAEISIDKSYVTFTVALSVVLAVFFVIAFFLDKKLSTPVDLDSAFLYAMDKITPPETNVSQASLPVDQEQDLNSSQQNLPLIDIPNNQPQNPVPPQPVITEPKEVPSMEDPYTQDVDNAPSQPVSQDTPAPSQAVSNPYEEDVPPPASTSPEEW